MRLPACLLVSYWTLASFVGARGRVGRYSCPVYWQTPVAYSSRRSDDAFVSLTAVFISASIALLRIALYTACCRARDKCLEGAFSKAA